MKESFLNFEFLSATFTYTVDPVRTDSNTPWGLPYGKHNVVLNQRFCLSVQSKELLLRISERSCFVLQATPVRLLPTRAIFLLQRTAGMTLR